MPAKLSILLLHIFFQGSKATRPVKSDLSAGATAAMKAAPVFDLKGANSSESDGIMKLALQFEYLCCAENEPRAVEELGQVDEDKCNDLGCVLDTRFGYVVKIIHKDSESPEVLETKIQNHCDLVSVPEHCSPNNMKACNRECAREMSSHKTFHEVVLRDAKSSHEEWKATQITEQSEANQEYEERVSQADQMFGVAIKGTKEAYDLKLSAEKAAVAVENQKLEEYVTAFKDAEHKHHEAVEAMKAFEQQHQEALGVRDGANAAAQGDRSERFKEVQRKVDDAHEIVEQWGQSRNGTAAIAPFPTGCYGPDGETREDCCCSIGGVPQLVPKDKFIDWKLCMSVDKSDPTLASQPIKQDGVRVSAGQDLYSRRWFQSDHWCQYFQKCDVCKQLVCRDTKVTGGQVNRGAGGCPPAQRDVESTP